MSLESPDTKTPPYALFSLRAIGVATLLSGPLGGTALISINCHRLGKPRQRNQAILLGTFSSLLLYGAFLRMPENALAKIPNLLIPFISCWLTYFLAAKLLRKTLKTHFAKGGPKASAWSTARWSLSALLASLGIAFLYMPAIEPYDFQGDAYEYGEQKHLIYHSPEVSPHTLEKLGDLLTDWEYFDSEYRYIAEVRNDAPEPSITLAFQREHWNDPETIAYLEGLKTAIERDIFEHSITLFLVDEDMKNAYRKPFKNDLIKRNER